MKGICILIAGFMLVGCGSENTTPRANRQAGASVVPAGPAAKPDLVNGATLTGTVVFAGTPPSRKAIDMSANPACERSRGKTPALTEDVVVNKNGTLENVFVWVKEGLPEKTWEVPGDAAVIDQQGCVYTPHVIGVVTGQGITIKNSDPTNHDVHPLPKNNQEFNESQPPGSEDRTRSFSRQEIMIPLTCAVHPWMRAYIGVVEHPFFAVTREDGTFRIAGLPPGTYTLESWQEKYGTQDRQVTVGPKDLKTVDFTYKQ